MTGNKKQTILITGINGYLGSNLAKSLQKEYNIIGLEYSTENLQRLAGFDFKVYATVKNETEQAFQENKIDIIIHTATIYGRNNESVQQIAQTNLYFACELLDKAIKSKVHCFVNTDTVLDKFTNAYAFTKVQFREWLQFRNHEIKVINMKLEHFYGPNAPEHNFITAMINRLQRNEPSIDLTAGEQKRDFVYIDDVIAAFNMVILKSSSLKDNFNEFEVTTDNSISIKQLMLSIKENIDSTTVLNFGTLPYRKGEIMETTSNNSELKSLGWTVKYDLETGLLKLL